MKRFMSLTRRSRDMFSKCPMPICRLVKDARRQSGEVLPGGRRLRPWAVALFLFVPGLIPSRAASEGEGALRNYTFIGEKHFTIPYSFFGFRKNAPPVYSIDSLKAGPGKFSFVPFPSPNPSMGFTAGASWVKITAENPGKEPVRAYLRFADAGIDELTFYHVRPDTLVACTTGVLYPFSRRDVVDREFIFRCVFPPQSLSTIYLRCKARSSVELPVSLMDEETFVRQQWTDHFMSGLVYGVLCFFVIAALYLSFIYRDANFRNFAVFIVHFCMLLAVRDGILYMYLWPEIPSLQYAAQNFFFVISVILGILFCIHFFKAERMHRLSTAFGYVFIIVLAASLLYSFAGNPQLTGLLLYGLALIAILYVLWIALATFRDHDRASRVCFFTWFVFLVLIAVRISINSLAISISPALGSFFHLGYNYHVGILAVAILTSIAISFRLRLIEKERNAVLIETATLQRRTLELKLSTLQARVQPHFLFNTLNTIANCIIVDPPAAERAVIELSDFYRMTLRHASRSLSRLKEEVDLVKRYLFLEKMKFGERLQFSFDIDDRCLNVSLPSMSLQVLVENSLKHGIFPKIEGGSIVISAAMIDTVCRIIVDDTGKGISKRKSDSGTGLANLRSRLELVYHGHFTLQIIDKQAESSAAEPGVKAVLEIPFQPVMKNIPETI